MLINFRSHTPKSWASIFNRPAQRIRICRIRVCGGCERSNGQHGPVWTIWPHHPRCCRETTEERGRRTGKQDCNLGTGMFITSWAGMETNQCVKESWLSTNAVSEDDRAATDQAQLGGAVTVDPMQALEELDMAGPKPEWTDSVCQRYLIAQLRNQLDILVSGRSHTMNTTLRFLSKWSHGTPIES